MTSMARTRPLSRLRTVRRRKEARQLVKHLTTDERHGLELKPVRKIDIRLLPMLVVMYIMNYLDRNNIAAAQLVGLEEEPNVPST